MTQSLDSDQIGDTVEPLSPLIEILQRGLDEAGILLAEATPRTTEEFSLWYLSAVQALETVVASQDSRAPMSRREVALMCRCALTASDLREAISLAIEFCDALTPRGGKHSLRINDNRAVFSMDSLRGEPSMASNLVDVTGLYAYYQLFRWLVGRALPLHSVGIGPAQRANSLPFLKLFDAPMLAGGQAYSLIFPATLLAAPVIRLTSELPAFLARFPCEVLGSTQDSLAQQIQALISAAIQQNSTLPTMEQIARALEIPESTLRRRLTQAGTSFRTIKTTSLFEAAQYYLLRDSYTIEQIAHRLGFSDDTAFRRAFISWAGVSPSGWRQVSTAPKTT